MRTRITELLGIEYPVFQGGMAWVGDENLAAAVSEAGGMGFLASANMTVELVKEKIRKVKSLTAKPFGVNLMMMNPNCDGIAALCAEERVAAVATGAGNPVRYFARWKEAGIRVLPVVPSAKIAEKMEVAGADAVIAEGMESGGHIGLTTTMCLVPQVVDAVSIPVVAAGGIADGRGAAAAFALGAEAVQCGTIFICAEESPACSLYKRLIVEAKGDPTVVTGYAYKTMVRSLNTEFSHWLAEHEWTLDRDSFEKVSSGSLRKAVQDGDLKEGSFMAGQIAGLVRQTAPAREIIEELMRDTIEQIRQLNGRV